MVFDEFTELLNPPDRFAKALLCYGDLASEGWMTLLEVTHEYASRKFSFVHIRSISTETQAAFTMLDIVSSQIDFLDLSR